MMKKVETIYRNIINLSPRRGRGIAALMLLAALALFATACIGGGKGEKVPPEISVRYPDVSTTDIPVSASVTITFNEAMKGISDSTVSLRRLSAAVDVPADITYDDASFTATLTPRDDLEPDSYYTATLAVTVRDVAGNRMVGAPISWVFTTGALNDTENPVITQRSPYPGEQNVVTDKTITVKFSELVNYVSGTTITLKETTSGTPVAGTVTYAAQIATFTPDAILTEGAQYTLSCVGGASGIRDASDNPLVSSEWAFKTEDTTAPTISTINPLENAVDVPPNVEIQVTMSESITNATNSTVFIKEVSTGVVYPGRVEYDDVSKTITLQPSGDLQYEREYQVTIEGDAGDSIMDTSFNVLAADRIWTFTTSDAPDEISPVVSAVTPLEGAGNITPSTDITIEFNEDVSGVTTSSVILKKNSDDSTVATTITYPSGPLTALVNPDADLEEGESYTVSCTDTIKDGAGNALVPKTWTFTIADETAPSVSSRSPEDLDTGVKKNGRVIVDFSENVTGVDDTTFYLKDAVNADVTAIVTYDSDAKRAILTPSSYLGDNESYTVYLTAGITDTSANANALVAMNWTFETENTLDTTAPVVSTKSPDVDDTDVALNAQPSITFDESVTGVSNTTFKVKDGADIVSGLVSFDAASKTATFYPDEDLKGGTLFTVEVTAGIQDLSGNAFVADSWTFTTEPDLAAPEFLNPSPTNGESGVPIDTSIVGQFNEHVNGVDATTFVVEDDQGTPYDAADVNISYDETTNVVIWSLKDSVLQRGTGTEYTVTITSGITDDAGNAFVETSWSFTTEPDTTPPTIMSGSETPRDTSTGISISSDITISFSEDIDLSSLNTTSFYVEDIATSTTKTDVTYSFDVNSKMAVLSLDTDLDPETDYRVTVVSGATGVNDLGQNSIASDYVWTFTTGQIPDTTAPTVDTVAPTDAATDVALNLASITAVFSEEVQNINSSTFQLKAAGIAVASSISYDNATKTATLSPTYNLIEGTTYTVELKTSITDMANNPLGSLYSWSFETGAADTIDPVVVSKSPEGAGAQVRPTITVVFSESVTGISTSTFTLSQDGSPVTEVDVFYDDSTKTATLIPRDPLTTDQCTVTLTGGIADLAGNNLTATSFNFTPVSSPEISSTSPVDGTGTSVDLAAVTINFNRDMDQTTGTAVLSGGSGYFGTPTWTDSDTIEYPVIGPLSAGTTYTVTFESWWESFKDTDGNELNTAPVVAGTLTFTTGSDGGAPSISSTVPVDGAVNVGVDIPVIVVNFDEPMTASGSLAGAGISAGTGVWSNDNKTVVFPMTGSLTAGSRTATLTGFTDAAGNALSGDTFSFTASSVTGSVLISEATDSFETYNEPDFTSYTNASGDAGDWAQAIKANNPTATPSDGSHMALGPALSWNSGDVGYLEQRSAADFSTAGSYILSLKMAHDADSSAADYLNVSVSTNGGSSYTSLAQPVYRYIYGFTPVYVVHSGTGLDDFDPAEYRSNTGRVRILAGDTVVSGINSGDYFVDASNSWFVISSTVEDNGTYDEIYIPRWQSVDLGAGARVMTLSSWTTYYFDLSSYAGESSVLIRLEAVSAGDTGGNIIIDDVQMRRY